MQDQHAPSRRLIWHLAGLAVLAYGLGAFVALYDYSFDTPSRLSAKTPWWDFANMWVGGRLALEGQLPVLFDPEAYRAVQRDYFGPGIADSEWSYPPVMLLLVAPLSLLPIGVAYWAWHLGTVALFAAVIRPYVTGVPARWVLVLSPAVIVSTVLGQNGALTAALVVGVFRFRRERAWLAGLCLGALLIKPHLALLIPFTLLAERNIRVNLWAALTVVTQITLVLAFWGPEAWVGFWQVTRPLMTEINNASFPQDYHLHAITVFAFFRSLGADLGSGYMAQGLMTLGSLGMVIWVFWSKQLDEAARVALVVALVPLATPYGYGYDLVMFAVPLAYVLTRADARILGYLLVIWCWPILTKIVATHGLYPSPILLASFALLVLWVGLRRTRHVQVAGVAA